jgi:hypothetical protein
MMFESLERFGDVVGHADVNEALCVIPVEMLSNIQSAGPVSGEGVFLLQYVQEMLGVILYDIFDSKVIAYEAEGDGSVFMCEQASGVG